MQLQPGSLFQRLREAEKRDPGNEVGSSLSRHLESGVDPGNEVAMKSYPVLYFNQETPDVLPNPPLPSETCGVLPSPPLSLEPHDVLPSTPLPSETRDVLPNPPIPSETVMSYPAPPLPSETRDVLPSPLPNVGDPWCPR